MTRTSGLLAVLVLVLAACGSSTGGGATTPDPTIAFCAALDNYAATLVKLDALPATASVDDYNKAVSLNPDADNKKAIEEALKDLGPDFRNTKMQ